MKELTTGTASTFQAVFTDGQNHWDNYNNQSGANYNLPTSGTHQVKNGQLLANAGSPCTTSTNNQAEVYYFTGTRGWSNVNIHYAPTGGTWTTSPGVAMNETACTSWMKKTVALGSATGMKAAFNNGTTWDNNGGSDYSLGTGRITVKDGVVTANAASPCVTLPPTRALRPSPRGSPPRPPALKSRCRGTPRPMIAA
ncbi:carbohydrate binding domain-containing protein [Cystobacter fuscus]